MISFLISAIKIIFLLGFLITIHETGHFIVAKLCKVKVNEFAIGFGPTILKKQGKETKYVLRLIPLGGFVSMEGEEGLSEEEGSFSKASIPKRFAIVSAGAIVNIVFGLTVFFILIFSMSNDAGHALSKTGEFVYSMVDSVKMLFTGQVGIEQMTGPVGISEVVVQTTNIQEFIYILALVSTSLGVTNLLPIPALDGGKLLLLIIEAIRRKKLNPKTELNIQLAGFSLLIVLSLYVTYNDIVGLF